MILVIGPQKETSTVIDQLLDLGVQRTAIRMMVGIDPNSVPIVVNKNSINKVIATGGSLGTTESCFDKVKKLSPMRPTIYFLNSEGKPLTSEKVRIVSSVEEIFQKQKEVAG